MSKSKPAQWTYLGPRDAIEIKLPSGRWLRVERGQSVEVLPIEVQVLKSLPHWEPTTAPKE